MSMINGWAGAIWTQLLIWGSGFAALGRLLAIGFACLRGPGTFVSRITPQLTSPEGLRTGFAFARAFLPSLALQKIFVKSYENSGSVIVTRYEDVKEVLRRDDDFAVVYEPRMRQITAGENFFLGMQDSPSYTRDVSNMRIAVRREDLPGLVLPFATARAGEIVASAPGKIDVPQALTLRVPAQLMGAYFGIPGPSEEALIEWTTLGFWYLFLDLAADADLDKRALAAAADFRAYLDGAIAARKASPTAADDVLNRCLAMQQAGLPGMDDLGIRNNLVGLIIGAVPTTSKAAIQALDQLLERPVALAGAQKAARADDDAGLAAHIFEALRFNPVNPMIYRRAVRGTMIAANTPRAVFAPEGSLVFAANLSAMFDPQQVAAPDEFRPGRPAQDYILWGDGLHTCFGAHINQTLIPALLKPLLRAPNLRRASGDAGQIDCGGTPFPQHLWLEFDRADT
jgi:cytochrome P450